MLSGFRRIQPPQYQVKDTMNNSNHCERDPGFMPMHGRSTRQVSDCKLKVKVRRQERRKTREVIRLWLGGSFSEEAVS
jgi:hypothetical protein